jgi:hypothetical protein
MILAYLVEGDEVFIKNLLGCCDVSAIQRRTQVFEQDNSIIEQFGIVVIET